jgi:hypothetical protein
MKQKTKNSYILGDKNAKIFWETKMLKYFLAEDGINL